MSSFDTHAVSRLGGRSVNMDAWAHAVERGVECWVVADGLGGHRRSEVAAQKAVDAVIGRFRESPAVTSQNADSLIQHAQEVVLAAKKAEPDLGQIATTIVVLVSDGNQAVWGHVGDSRLYHISGGVVAFQTRDHSVSQARVSRGDLRPEDLRGDKGRGALLRALGHPGRVRPTVEGPRQLHRGDAFLMCVDGFWDKVHETEMEIDFAKSRTAEEWMLYLERRVAARADADSDNYTALTVLVQNVALPLPAASRRASATTARASSAIVSLWKPLGTAALAFLVSLTAFFAFKTFYADGNQSTLPGAAATSDCVAAWQDIEASRDPEAYEKFARDRSTCKEAELVAVRLAEIKEWRSLDLDNPCRLQGFLEKFEKGRYRLDAEAMVRFVGECRQGGAATAAAVDPCNNAREWLRNADANTTLQEFAAFLRVTQTRCKAAFQQGKQKLRPVLDARRSEAIRARDSVPERDRRGSTWSEGLRVFAEADTLQTACDKKDNCSPVEIGARYARAEQAFEQVRLAARRTEERRPSEIPEPARTEVASPPKPPESAPAPPSVAGRPDEPPAGLPVTPPISAPVETPAPELRPPASPDQSSGSPSAVARGSSPSTPPPPATVSPRPAPADCGEARKQLDLRRRLRDFEERHYYELLAAFPGCHEKDIHAYIIANIQRKREKLTEYLGRRYPPQFSQMAAAYLARLDAEDARRGARRNQRPANCAEAFTKGDDQLRRGRENFPEAAAHFKAAATCYNNARTSP